MNACTTTGGGEDGEQAVGYSTTRGVVFILPQWCRLVSKSKEVADENRKAGWMRDLTKLQRPVGGFSLPAMLIRNMNTAALPKRNPDPYGAEWETDKQEGDTGKQI